MKKTMFLALLAIGALSSCTNPKDYRTATIIEKPEKMWGIGQYLAKATFDCGDTVEVMVPNEMIKDLRCIPAEVYVYDNGISRPAAKAVM